MFAYPEAVTIQSPGTVTDPYSGESSEDWGSATQRAVDGIGVADGGSAEPLQDARNALEADYDLFFPPTETVTRADRVIVRGDQCQVVGKPFLWRHPMTGWTPGLVVQVKLSEG